MAETLLKHSEPHYGSISTSSGTVWHAQNNGETASEHHHGNLSDIATVQQNLVDHQKEIKSVYADLKFPPGADCNDDKVKPHRPFALIHCKVVLVEVVVAMYFLTKSTADPVIQFYLIKRTAEDHVNWTSSQILDKVSDYNILLSCCTNLPAIIPTLFLGALADRFGRKFAMISGMLGGLMRSCAYIAVIHLEARIEFIYIGNFLEGITGSYGALLMGVYGMVADMTQPGPQRNLRITTTEASIFIFSSVGTIASGYWMEYLGHETPLVFAAGVQMAAILYILLFLPESLRRENTTPFSCSSLKTSFVLFTSKEPRGRRPVLLCTLLAFGIGIYLIISNNVTALLYYQGGSFKWGATKFTIFGGVFVFSSWLCVVIMTRLLGKRCHESTFGLIGAISSCVGLLVNGLAINDLMIYTSAIVSLVAVFNSPMTRAILSKHVNASEQGSLFAGVGVVEMLFTLIGGVAAPALFKVGLKIFYGFHALVASGLAAILVVIFVVLRYYLRRWEECGNREILVQVDQPVTDD